MHCQQALLWGKETSEAIPWSCQPRLWEGIHLGGLGGWDMAFVALAWNARVAGDVSEGTGARLDRRRHDRHDGAEMSQTDLSGSRPDHRDRA